LRARPAIVADWHQLSLAAMLPNILIFLAAAAVVWFAGVGLARCAQQVAERARLGKALVGLILLGAVTSLPEVATSLTAAFRAEVDLAVNNLLGGVAMQVVILSIVDLGLRGRALSSVIARPVILLQGTFSILLLALVAAVLVAGEIEVLGMGAGTVAIAALYVLGVFLLSRYEENGQWTPREAPEKKTQVKDTHEDDAQISNRRLALYTGLAALAILCAGYILTTRAEALAEQTGLGSSFFGAVFLAISTSLPEISTALAAVRLGEYEMAFSDAFGANLFDTALLFVVDVVHRDEAVLSTAGDFSLFAAILGIALTGIFLAGLIERRDRAFLRLGLDSIVVLAIYAGGLVVLYQLR
jgi:cation:H+ antiporter